MAQGDDAVAPFISKLRDMVDDTSLNELIGWSKDGTAVIVHDPKRFEKEVLQTSFKSKFMASFMRNLSYYGFKKLVAKRAVIFSGNSDAAVFIHPAFRRSRPELLGSIKRHTVDHTQDETVALRDELLRAQNKIAELEQALEDARAELSSLRVSGAEPQMDVGPVAGKKRRRGRDVVPGRLNVRLQPLMEAKEPERPVARKEEVATSLPLPLPPSSALLGEMASSVSGGMDWDESLYEPDFGDALAPRGGAVYSSASAATTSAEAGLRPWLGVEMEPETPTLWGPDVYGLPAPGSQHASFSVDATGAVDDASSSMLPFAGLYDRPLHESDKGLSRTWSGPDLSLPGAPSDGDTEPVAEGEASPLDVTDAAVLSGMVCSEDGECHRASLVSSLQRAFTQVPPSEQVALVARLVHAAGGKQTALRRARKVAQDLHFHPGPQGAASPLEEPTKPLSFLHRVEEQLHPEVVLQYLSPLPACTAALGRIGLSLAAVSAVAAAAAAASAIAHATPDPTSARPLTELPAPVATVRSRA